MAKLKVACALLSGVLLILSFPPFDLGIMAFFALAPLVFSLQGATRKVAFKYAFLTGSIFFAGTVWWLCHVTVVGMAVLVLYLACYFGAFGFAIASFRQSEFPQATFLLLVPFIWVFLEWLRTHLVTGFGWALLGYSQWRNLRFIQFADALGIWGVSFLVVLVNITIFYIIRYRKKALWYGVFTACLIFGALAYGVSVLRGEKEDKSIKVSLIQGDIPQDVKWDEGSKNLILEKYLLLTHKAAQDEPDLIIWPETSFPAYWEEAQDLQIEIFALAREINRPLLIGAPTSTEAGNYNSALLISHDGRELMRHNKLHLVPFGEYVPFARRLPLLARMGRLSEVGNFSSGDRFTLFPISSATVSAVRRLGVLVCFEDLFPHLVRRFRREGADLLVVLTNDAWFGKSAASLQHAQATVFRAIENRIPILRCANTGYTCLIDKYGRIHSSLRRFQAGALTGIIGW